MMVTTMPILVPAMTSMGLEMVWFGIIMVILIKGGLGGPTGGPQPLYHSRHP
jgi:TRAP-type C4-dicarboxylate transport system permease large subunit